MRREVPPPEEWDGGEWVDVGPDGRWHPSAGERARALVVLALVIGVLAVVAAVLAVGGDEGDDDDVAATSTTSTTEGSATSSTSSTTTVPVDPASVGGAPPPPQCATDDRAAAPLRDPGQVVVRVLNGTSRGGHAASVSDDLEDAGYRMLEPSNADLLAVTRVAHAPGYCAEAVALVGVLAIPGSEVVADGAGSAPPEAPPSNVTVTLGRDSL